MEFPFTIDQFLNVFKSYNQYVFPFQSLFIAIAIVIIILVVKSSGNKLISALLSFLWLWIGIVYHIAFFSVINPAAYFFGAIFIIQGILFFILGVVKGELVFHFSKRINSFIGFSFILYALLIYPILNYQLGHPYPYSPTFGLPCPTTIFTLGVLLFIKNRVSFYIFFIPLLWSLVGFSAAVNLKIYEDFGLLFAGLISTVLFLINNKRISSI